LSLKVFRLLSAGSDISTDGFDREWRGRYSDGVASLDGLRGYVQLPATANVSPFGVSSPFTGIDELWFDELDAAIDAISDARWGEGPGSSDPALLGEGGSRWLVAQENVVVDGPETGRSKMLFLFHHRPDQTLQDCQSYWRTQHAKLVPGSPGLARYVQSHVLPGKGADEVDGFDGIAELWFPDLKQTEIFSASEEFRIEQGDDIPKFCDLGRLQGFLADAPRVVV